MRSSVSGRVPALGAIAIVEGVDDLQRRHPGRINAGLGDFLLWASIAGGFD
jgi:hypothetical protein